MAEDSQTQPAVSNLVSDIFGDSDDEESISGSHRAGENDAAEKGSVDDIFPESDDDGEPVRARSSTSGRLQKTSASKAAGLVTAAANIIDSDDEDNTKLRQHAAKKSKGLKRIRDAREERIKKKKRNGKPVKGAAGYPETSVGRDDDSFSGESSGGEYDSGEEAIETADDRRFIDNEDDQNADLVREYEQDNQNFDDEDPALYRSSGKNSKKGRSKNSIDRVYVSRTTDPKDLDPMSQALLAMKNPKSKGMSDPEKEVFIDKLQLKMAQAVQLDDQLFAAHQPAIHKMQLLDTVRSTVSMWPLQHMLLEKDILSSLRDWIEPRTDKQRSLPALSVRTAVYEMLLKLPALPEHLKRAKSDKPPIGFTIVALRKHKMETPANKRLLKEIMDKWSRPIFSKTASVSSAGGGAVHNETAEVREALIRKYIAGVEEGGRPSMHDNNYDTSSKAENEGITGPSVQFGSTAMSKDGVVDRAPGGDPRARVRTPFNQGFLFTVQPELKTIEKTNVVERSLGEGRMKLFKKMTESRSSKGSALGKKLNPRAMDSSVSKPKV